MVHILFLAQPGLRLTVCLQWMWTLLTGQGGARLIVGVGREADRPDATVKRAAPDVGARATP
jgi:hypothetical protein